METSPDLRVRFYRDSPGEFFHKHEIVSLPPIVAQWFVRENYARLFGGKG